MLRVGSVMAPLLLNAYRIIEELRAALPIAVTLMAWMLLSGVSLR
ncbi:MAG: hypothetical protein RXO28_02720 [Thermocladium sp.]